MRVALYARVSTDDQSCDMQLRELREYAAQAKLEIVHEYVDQGVSGATVKRPALDAMMSDARKRKFSGVLVWRFDRFARSTKHLVDALTEFRRLDIRFMSYNENIDTSSPIGEAIFTIIGAVAQLERDIIRERVRAGLKNAKAKGRQLGRPKLTDDDEIRSLRDSGLSIRQIAQQVQVSPRAVQRSLKSE